MIPPIIPLIPIQHVNSAIKFSLDRSDVWVCRLIVLSQNRFIIIFSLACSAFVGMSTLSGPQITNGPIGLKIFTFVGTTLLIFLFLALFNAAVQAAFTLFRKNPGVVGEHEFEIRDDGLFERTSLNEGVYRWSGVSKIRCVGRFLFIYVSGNQVHYIPRNAFPSLEAFRDFRAEIENRAAAAHSSKK